MTPTNIQMSHTSLSIQTFHLGQPSWLTGSILSHWRVTANPFDADAHSVNIILWDVNKGESSCPFQFHSNTPCSTFHPFGLCCNMAGRRNDEHFFPFGLVMLNRTVCSFALKLQIVFGSSWNLLSLKELIIGTKLWRSAEGQNSNSSFEDWVESSRGRPHPLS